MKQYPYGLEILGDDALTSRAVLIKVRNPQAVARSQGALAGLAAGLAPATIETAVYNGLAEKLEKALRQEQVDADVSVVDLKSLKKAGASSVTQEVAAGVTIATGIVGAVILLWRWSSKRKKR